MKKSLVIALVLAFVLSIAATAMAAPANPFVDVPAKHWAYDAVSKLAKAGIVDGYGDGTFRGDKTMTRYEMAQIVAKAMARSDKANAENKALIDKLAVEFAAELNNLGVRVAALESNSSTPFGPSAKVYGDARTKYQKNPTALGALSNSNLPLTAAQAAAVGSAYSPYSAFAERFRVNFDMNMNDSVYMMSRLTYQNKLSGNQAADSTYGGFLGQQAVNLDYGHFTFRSVFTGVDFRIGRQVPSTGYGLIYGGTGGYDAATFLFNGGKELKGWVAYGDIFPYIAYGGLSGGSAFKTTNTNPAFAVNAMSGALSGEAIDVTMSNWVWTPAKDFQMTGSLYWSNTNNYNYKVWNMGAKGNLTPGLYLAGDYAHNTASGPIFLGDNLIAPTANTSYPIGNNGIAVPVTSNQSQKTAYFMQLGYHHGDNGTTPNGIDYNNPGAFGLFLNYKHYGGQAVDWNNTSILVFENITDQFLFTMGEKGFGYAIQYVPVKNVRLTGTYEQMKSLDGSVKRPAFTYIRAEYNW